MPKPIKQFCVALSIDPVFNNNYYHCFLISVVWPRIMSDFWNTVIHCIDVNNLKEQPLEGEQCVFLEKYPDPHHGGNWKFWRDWRLKGLGNSCGVRGLKTQIHFQGGTTIVSHWLLWVVPLLSLVMLHFSYHASAQNDFSFFNESCFKVN